MTGVDILAMEEVAVEFAFNWTTFSISMGIIVLIGIGYGIYEVVSGGEELVFIPSMAILFMLFGAMAGVGGGLLLKTPTKYETQYKVTISDEVAMTGFLEKYEIIDTEGKIYTVREKGE